MSIKELNQIQKELGVFLWGKPLSNEAFECAEQIMPFIEKLINKIEGEK